MATAIIQAAMYLADSEELGFELLCRPSSACMRRQIKSDYDGSSTYGDEWRWAGAQQSHNAGFSLRLARTLGGLLDSPKQVPTCQRRLCSHLPTMLPGRTMHCADSEKLSFELRRRPASPRVSGKRNLGQGKPQAKDSSGGRANWNQGVTSEPVSVNL